MITAIYDLREYGWRHSKTENDLLEYTFDIWRLIEIEGEDHYILKKKSRTVKEGTFLEVLNEIKKLKLLTNNE